MIVGLIKIYQMCFTVYEVDLALIQHPIKLHSSRELAEITDLAQDKEP